MLPKATRHSCTSTDTLHSHTRHERMVRIHWRWWNIARVMCVCVGVCVCGCRSLVLFQVLQQLLLSYPQRGTLHKTATPHMRVPVTHTHTHTHTHMHTCTHLALRSLLHPALHRALHTHTCTYVLSRLRCRCGCRALCDSDTALTSLPHTAWVCIRYAYSAAQW